MLSFTLQKSLPNIVRSPFKDKLKQQQTVSIDMVNLEAKEQDNFISDLHPVIETEEQS